MLASGEVTGVRLLASCSAYEERTEMQIVQPVLTILSLCGLVKPAYAYIDPGTAGMALQVLIGAVAAVMSSLKRGNIYWKETRRTAKLRTNLLRPELQNGACIGSVQASRLSPEGMMGAPGHGRRPRTN